MTLSENHRIRKREIASATVPSIVAGAVFFLVDAARPDLLATYQYLISPIMVVVAALTALLTGVAFTNANIRATAHNAKVKAAFDAVAKKSWDKDYIAARQAYNVLVKSNDDLAAYIVFIDNPAMSEAERERRKADVSAIRNIANDHELTAIAIRRHVIDEDFIRYWNKSVIVDDHRRLAGYIDAVREASGNAIIT